MKLALSGVGLDHPGQPGVLRGISLTLQPGEQVALIGPSGAGKSTLLGLLATAFPASEGELLHDGAMAHTLASRRLRQLRRTIGWMQQSPPLPASQRVATAVSAGRIGQWSGWRAARNLLRVDDPAGITAALSAFGIADKAGQPVDALSGGQRQRVALARVRYQQPALILLDEPIAALDPDTARRTLVSVCDDARARNATLIASLHAVDLALTLFPRVIGLREGGIAFDAPAAAITPDMLADLYRPVS